MQHSSPCVNQCKRDALTTIRNQHHSLHVRLHIFSQIEAIKGCAEDKSKLGNAEQFYAELIGLPGILSKLSFNVLEGFEMSVESQNRLSSNVT